MPCGARAYRCRAWTRASDCSYRDVTARRLRMPCQALRAPARLLWASLCPWAETYRAQARPSGAKGRTRDGMPCATQKAWSWVSPVGLADLGTPCAWAPAAACLRRAALGAQSRARLARARPFGPPALAGANCARMPCPRQYSKAMMPSETLPPRSAEHANLPESLRESRGARHAPFGLWVHQSADPEQGVPAYGLRAKAWGTQALFRGLTLALRHCGFGALDH